jgi:hypothetical protein
VERILALATRHMLRSGIVISALPLGPDEFGELERRELRLASDILSEGVLL